LRNKSKNRNNDAIGARCARLNTTVLASVLASVCGTHSFGRFRSFHSLNALTQSCSFKGLRHCICTALVRGRCPLSMLHFVHSANRYMHKMLQKQRLMAFIRAHFLCRGAPRRALTTLFYLVRCFAPFRPRALNASMVQLTGSRPDCWTCYHLD
jgi:hypothetical protein